MARSLVFSGGLFGEREMDWNPVFSGGLIKGSVGANWERDTDRSPVFGGGLIGEIDMDLNPVFSENMAKDITKDDLEKSVDEVEEEDRGQWTGKLDFLLSCLSFAVGVGNIWRFPYMCYKNGGAVFLIPYLIMLVLVGLPAFYMELCLGQFSGKGPVDIWAAVPIMRGIGYTMLMNSFVQAIYYILLLAWSLYYLLASFASVLPWSRCMQGISTWATKSKYNF
ncbi:Sodium- and chloride-dependent neutral and basic amino acid transporter B(0+) [Nymphon striatum]|nr:Sodium- and chloride-dependent neutral and basic amino acid transporter B(0+) [Nymphon striatum]